MYTVLGHPTIYMIGGIGRNHGNGPWFHREIHTLTFVEVSHTHFDQIFQDSDAKPFATGPCPFHTLVAFLLKVVSKIWMMK